MTLPGGEVIVHKCNPEGREVWSWHASLREATSTSIRVEARFNGQEGVFHGLNLRRGDRFLETYYADRGYNVFAIFDAATDQFKGWYCNIARPARIEDGHVRFDDLALDLLVLPDGTMHVLDEDEFERLDLDDAERVLALGSLKELQELASARAGPFAPASNILPPLHADWRSDA